jgi:hypothetical protein
MELLYLSKGYLQVLGKFGHSADSHVVVLDHLQQQEAGLVANGGDQVCKSECLRKIVGGAVWGETGDAWSIMNGVVRCLGNLVLQPDDVVGG